MGLEYVGRDSAREKMGGIWCVSKLGYNVSTLVSFLQSKVPGPRRKGIRENLQRAHHGRVIQITVIAFQRWIRPPHQPATPPISHPPTPLHNANRLADRQVSFPAIDVANAQLLAPHLAKQVFPIAVLDTKRMPRNRVVRPAVVAVVEVSKPAAFLWQPGVLYATRALEVGRGDPRV